MHTSALRNNTGKRSIVVEALEFLQPYKRTNTNTNTRRNRRPLAPNALAPANSEQQNNLVETEPSSQTLVNTPFIAVAEDWQIIRLRQIVDFFFQSAHSVPNDPENRSSIVGNWVNGMNFSPMLNRETIEQNDSCYEIYYEDDGPTNNSIESSAPTANYFPAGFEPFDDVDGDVAFGSIIISELQKMPPHIKRQFKRNVAQMLFD